MTYAQMLRDPRWQKKRLEVFERAGFACEECGAKDKELQVHHRHYQNGAKPWEYADDFLRCLCADCHSKRTDLDRTIKYGLGLFNYQDAVRVLMFMRRLHGIEPKPEKPLSISEENRETAEMKKHLCALRAYTDHEKAITILAKLKENR